MKRTLPVHLRELRAQMELKALGLRDVSRLTGIAYTRCSALLNGSLVAPSDLERLQMAIQTAPELDAVPLGEVAERLSPFPGLPMTPAKLTGEEVRNARHSLGLTLEVLADAVGCHPSTINNLENGHDEPSWKLSRALRTALELPAPEVPLAR